MICGVNRLYYTMFTIQLKNGETVLVPPEDLEQYIKNNRTQIQEQHVKMGRRRASGVDTTPSISNK